MKKEKYEIIFKFKTFHWSKKDAENTKRLQEKKMPFKKDFISK